ncbi:MAG: hypothetical protein EXR36_10205 [Betaproteobacteria bacterium]|nr:hypothetical protein [Betaproteobacteria bacterium]
MFRFRRRSTLGARWKRAPCWISTRRSPSATKLISESVASQNIRLHRIFCTCGSLATREARLRRSARTRPVVVLTGARQTGKTSLLRRLFPKYGFVSLDLPTEAEQAEKEPAIFLSRHPAPAIIDEVQYAPALIRHLKAAVDANRGRNGQRREVYLII